MKKRIVSLILAIVMVATLIPTAFAVGGVRLEVAPTTVQAGDTVEAVIVLPEVENFAGLHIELEYDNEKLIYDGATSPDVDGAISHHEETANVIVLAMEESNTYTLPEGSVALAVSFTVREGAVGQATIKIGGQRSISQYPAGSFYPKSFSTSWAGKQTVTIEAAPVSATGVSLSTEELNLTVGESATLRAAVEPSDAANKAVIWESSDESVATVDANGKVTAIKAGFAIITVTTVDGGFTAECEVTVSDAPKPTKTITEADITVGEAVYNGGAAVEPSVTVAGLDESDYVVEYTNNTEAGTATVTVRPADGGKYNFAPVSKKFTIQKASLTITAKSFKIQVGEKAPSLNGAYSVKGLLGNDTLETNPTVSYAKTPDTSKIGSYVIEVSGPAEQKNYEISYVNGKLTITAGDEDSDESSEPEAEDAFSCKGGADCLSHRFTDVDPNQWYHEGIDYVVKHGLMAGVSDTLFGTHDTTTRGMIVTILYRMAGTPDVKGENPFKDVAAGKYYTKAVIWAYENKIVAGISADKFAPDSAITREQMATMLYNYAKYMGYDVSDDSADMDGFVDNAKVSGYAAAALEWACSEELIAGVPVGAALKLDPQGNAERCQVASIIMRFCKNFVE